MPRVSEDHLNARREQILAAARTCFLRNGIHNTSMQDLIQEAGLSVGAVYRYFKSKTEIINAISQTFTGTITAGLTQVSDDPELGLRDAMSRALDLVDAQVAPGGMFPLGIQVWGEALRDPAIAEIVKARYSEMRTPFVALARRAVERGELPPGTDPEAVASVLFGSLPGYALQHTLIGTPDKATYLAGLHALLAR
ncbi:TetR/AcrR family transcriptional regulator [Actinoplanes sp. RD1]|uniref:TetR/AcrR family transcriptional regulator n=1 Tax=Actinoplanes sp. RD1 TaxID=3064538 RepID=UPI0027411187|nr:TetR/AcrR family transcriptional regulator [Actinoplanes sp. RD1]